MVNRDKVRNRIESVAILISSLYDLAAQLQKDVSQRHTEDELLGWGEHV